MCCMISVAHIMEGLADKVLREITLKLFVVCCGTLYVDNICNAPHRTLKLFVVCCGTLYVDNICNAPPRTLKLFVVCCGTLYADSICNVPPHHTLFFFFSFPWINFIFLWQCNSAGSHDPVNCKRSPQDGD